jgi:hypothetical protein
MEETKEKTTKKTLIFRAQTYNAHCKKAFGPYQTGKSYNVWVDDLFSTRPYSLLERSEYESVNKKFLPEKAVIFEKGPRKCMYNYFAHDGSSDYVVFDSEEVLSEHFDLIPA